MFAFGREIIDQLVREHQEALDSLSADQRAWYQAEQHHREATAQAAARAGERAYQELEELLAQDIETYGETG